MTSLCGKLKRLLATLLVTIPISSPGAAVIPIIDAHSQVDEHISFEEIITLMNKARVSRAILALRGRRQPEELISFAARHPDRITAAVRTKGGAYLKEPRPFNRFLDKQLQISRFAAIGEVLLRHAKKKRSTNRYVRFRKERQTPASRGSAG